MNVKEFFKSLFAKILQHYIISILAITLPTSALFELYTTYKPISNYAVPFFRWYWTPWIFLTALCVYLLVRRLLKKIRKKEQHKQEIPPKYFASHDQRFVDRPYANVMWKVMVGSDAGSAMSNKISEESIRVWMKKNPYCPECDFELERIGKKWHCIPCSKSYSIPRNLRDDTWLKMRKIFQRYIMQLARRNWMIGEKPQIPFHKYLQERKGA